MVSKCFPDWDNPYRNEFFWVSGVLLVTVGILGLVGNSVNLVVLTKSYMRKVVFYNLLANLASYDIVFILSFGVRVGYESLACQPAEDVFHYITDSLLQFSYTGSVFSTVAISVERCVGTWSLVSS